MSFLRRKWRQLKRYFSRAKNPEPKPTPVVNEHNSNLDLEDSKRLGAMFFSTVILPHWQPKVEYITEKILNNKAKYINASNRSGVPWEVIAAIHSLEGGLNFNRILHNGEKLPIRRTRLVPKGRGPFSTWEAAAADALAMKKSIFPKKWTVGATLDFLERYNGLGYRKYHSSVNTPYLWSGTPLYKRGKYVSDGKWSSSAVSRQVGAVAILKDIGFQGE